ncbi:MAG: hypothetical protein FIB06_05375 [Betaproteobacteria bacterium]|nr:hypothetical protein [Betaproteobacteria bacterium]
MSSRIRRLALAALAAWSLVASLATAESVRFGLIGDTPYSTRERAELPAMLDAMADSPVDFIVHVGDIKSGRERCDDALFADRHALFDSARVPFVFVPGDNEWTDCDRVSNGGYAPLERLTVLRRLFWRDPFALGPRTLALERQAGAYPEHSRFRRGPLLFVTLNLPGGNNNRGLADEPRQEFLERNPVVLAWLRDSFALARRGRLAGIVLLFQGNPGFRHHAQGAPHAGFRDFLEALRDETLAFPGRVLVVHGDTHISRIDQPLRDRRGKPIPALTRVEVFGYPFMGWTRVVADEATPGLFRFETHPWPPRDP